MANYTGNYNLYRPSRNDVDIEVDTSLDSNFISIDGEMKKIDKKVAGVIHLSDFNPVGDGVTDDQTAVVNAVTEAFNKNMALNWGNGTYLTTANIPNFHSVKHIGEGIVKRGTDLFYISPKGTQRNKIYLNPSGSSNTFDGLSAAQPVRQLSVACGYLANYGPVLKGYWELVMSAGTHDRRGEIKAGLLSENPIEITGADVGGHPNVPTTILSEGTGIGAVGITVSDGTKIKVKNVKFIGFNGTTSSGGITCSNSSQVFTENCHFQDCFYGISSLQRSKVDVKGGIFENCGKTNTGTGTGSGVRSLQLSNHAIGTQNAGALTSGPIFKNCRYGVWAQESSTGHVDWCTFEDNEDGFVGRVNSRGNLDGCSFKRNQRAVRLEGVSHAFISANTSFGTGTDANTVTITRSSGSSVTSSSVIEGLDVSREISERIFEIANKNQTITTTTATVFHTVNLLAPFWRNTPSSLALSRKLRIKIYGTLNGTASNKRLNVRLGTMLAACTFGATDTGTFEAEGHLYFTGANAQYLFLSATRHQLAAKQSKAVGTNEMTANTALTLEAYVDNAADSVVIDMIEISWAG